jgi:hypothetical protein
MKWVGSAKDLKPDNLMELRRTEKPVKIQKKTMVVKLTGTGRDLGGRVHDALATV